MVNIQFIYYNILNGHHAEYFIHFVQKRATEYLTVFQCTIAFARINLT